MRYLSLLSLLISFNVTAVTIADIEIPDVVFHSEQPTKLQLNGASIRTKFFFDIYNSNLYFENKASTTEAV